MSHQLFFPVPLYRLTWIRFLSRSIAKDERLIEKLHNRAEISKIFLFINLYGLNYTLEQDLKLSLFKCLSCILSAFRED